jgi:hypothetical protein
MTEKKTDFFLTGGPGWCTAGTGRYIALPGTGPPPCPDVSGTRSFARFIRQTRAVNGNAGEIGVNGRHDPCIVPRIIPVAESMLADCWLEPEKYRRERGPLKGSLFLYQENLNPCRIPALYPEYIFPACLHGVCIAPVPCNTISDTPAELP